MKGEGYSDVQSLPLLIYSIQVYLSEKLWFGLNYFEINIKP